MKFIHIMVINETKIIFVIALNHNNVYTIISCLLMVFIQRLPTFLWLGLTRYLPLFREGYPSMKLK